MSVINIAIFVSFLFLAYTAYSEETVELRCSLTSPAPSKAPSDDRRRVGSPSAVFSVPARQ